MRRLAKALMLAAGIALVSASPAAGHAFYVQAGAPPGGNCLSESQPCQTINDALAMADDVVLVGPGIYNESVTVDAGKLLIAMGTPSPGSHVIEWAGPAPTVTVIGSDPNPAVLVGFTVKGPKPVLLSGPGRVSGNYLTGAAVADEDPHIRIQGSGTRVVEGNTFDDDGTGRQVGAEVEPASTGSPLIANNTLSDLWHGVEARAGTPTVRGNIVEGTHNDGGAEGEAILIANASPTLSGNVVRSPATAGGVPTGVHVDGSGGSTGATLLRNQVLDHDPGVRVGGATAPVSLSSDLIARGENGLAATDTSVSATNLTAFDAATADIALQNTALTLNSSIVEHPIAAAGASTCAISFSAGPSTGSGCEGFQQPSSSPGFVDPGSANYGLSSGSPLIDAGDPSAPPPGSLDLNGDPRAAAATCGGSERRDIGADELVTSCPPSSNPPPDEPPTGPGPALPPRDSDPPETRIDKTKIRGRTAQFHFSADEPATGFQCRLDDGRYRKCGSPKRYRRLDDGGHVFRVKAVDIAGNEDSGSARKRFRIR